MEIAWEYANRIHKTKLFTGESVVFSFKEWEANKPFLRFYFCARLSLVSQNQTDEYEDASLADLPPFNLLRVREPWWSLFGRTFWWVFPKAVHIWFYCFFGSVNLFLSSSVCVTSRKIQSLKILGLWEGHQKNTGVKFPAESLELKAIQYLSIDLFLCKIWIMSYYCMTL